MDSNHCHISMLDKITIQKNTLYKLPVRAFIKFFFASIVFIVSNATTANTDSEKNPVLLDSEQSLVRMQEIDPESCNAIKPTSTIKPIYQVVSKPQVPTTEFTFNKLTLIDLLDEQQLIEYLATRSGAPPLETQLQGLLVTEATASDGFASYAVQGKITNNFQINNLRINSTPILLESPEISEGRVRIVLSDIDGIKIDARRYDLKQIVFIQTDKAIEPRLTTVKLLTSCIGANVFATDVDGRVFSFQKNAMDFRLLLSTEKSADSISFGFAGNHLFDQELPEE